MNSEYPIVFFLSVLLWISIFLAQHFLSSSLLFILKMNRINSCEAKKLGLSDWMMTFFASGWRSCTVSTANWIIAATCTWSWPDYPLIAWSKINIQIHWLPHQLSTLYPQFPTNSCPFHHNNQPVPPDSSSAILFVCGLEKDKWWMDMFHLLHIFSIAENFSLACRLCEA